ncbi:MAG: hypothetical protein JNL38_14615, partial [Myxococcales bacterium]|nr:hypothetical protein [Myxococcales bacterium]
MTRSRLMAAFLGGAVAACQVLVGIGHRDARGAADAGDGAPGATLAVDASGDGAGALQCKLGTVACKGSCVDDRTSGDHCGACD